MQLSLEKLIRKFDYFVVIAFYRNNCVAGIIINPRRACTARVTVLGLSVVCLLPCFLPLRTTRQPISDINGFSATLGLFLK